jgi:hypothetical protein
VHLGDFGKEVGVEVERDQLAQLACAAPAPTKMNYYYLK